MLMKYQHDDDVGSQHQARHHHHHQHHQLHAIKEEDFAQTKVHSVGAHPL